jgi:hypothetical protein
VAKSLRIGLPVRRDKPSRASSQSLTAFTRDRDESSVDAEKNHDITLDFLELPVMLARPVRGPSLAVEQPAEHCRFVGADEGAQGE